MDDVKRIFYPGSDGDFLVRDWCGDHRRQDPVSCRSFDRATVLPPFPVANAFGGSYSETGVADASGKYIPGSGMFTGTTVGDAPFADDAAYMDETVIFCGMLYFHYGHFLIQSTTRLYHVLREAGESYKLVFAADRVPDRLPAYMADFFQLVGIPRSRLMLIDRPTGFRRVILPDISSRYFQDWTPEFLLPFRKAAENVAPAADAKVFFSRKRWTGLAKCLGEDALERLFVRNGFSPVMPETLSLRQQIACIKGARVLAGINGTSFHNILFGEPGQKLIILNRNAEYDSQYILNDACRADWYVVKVHANPLPVNHPHGPFIVGVTPELREFCGKHGLNTFGIPFRPEKYLKAFLRRFMLVYAQTPCLREFAGRYRNQLPADALVQLFIASGALVRRRLLWRILGRLLPGKAGESFRLRYAAAKACGERDFKWKY